MIRKKGEFEAGDTVAFVDSDGRLGARCEVVEAGERSLYLHGWKHGELTRFHDWKWWSDAPWNEQEKYRVVETDEERVAKELMA
ncbi:MAG TPA: hypothetical protein VMZ50_08420 [Phycisphaerae bacterium]|nr:hypothetical protein [Phycisphaerae bacterium]